MISISELLSVIGFESGVFIKIFFIFFSITIAFADIKTGEVPRIAFFIAFPLFMASRLLQNEPHSLTSIFGGTFIGLFVFLLAFFLSHKMLGLADVWYSSLIGLVLGPLWWYAAMSCACIAGIICMLVLRRRKIPFIPLMALGGVAMIIASHYY